MGSLLDKSVALMLNLLEPPTDAFAECFTDDLFSKLLKIVITNYFLERKSEADRNAIDFVEYISD